MGCGLGSTARFLVQRSPHARVTGFTIVPAEAASGNRMSQEHGLETRVAITLCDYRATPLESASLDGAYAIASTAYAAGPDKADLIAEMARIVKPGGRIEISDGFRKDSQPLRGIVKRAYASACRSWAITEMADIQRFKKALRAAGFQNVCAEEISSRVAPSYAHVPFLCAKFALQHWLKGELRWSSERWRNVRGPLCGAVLGLHPNRFGYYLVSAVRETHPPPAPREW
jgi:cyclopropane fatty-acyl-phospholipid synthase-like methyltransferase